jgi:hypothetical protein
MPTSGPLVIQELQKDPATHPHYQQVNNHLNKKGKIVEGHKPTLQNKLIALNHDTAMDGHSGALVIAKRVGGLFYWKHQQRLIRQFVRECPIYQRSKPENINSAQNGEDWNSDL